MKSKKLTKKQMYLKSYFAFGNASKKIKTNDECLWKLILDGNFEKAVEAVADEETAKFILSEERCRRTFEGVFNLCRAKRLHV